MIKWILRNWHKFWMDYHTRVIREIAEESDTLLAIHLDKFNRHLGKALEGLDSL